VETDPGLAARILRLANSPFFAVKGEISSLGRAIVQIGLIETINTAQFYLFRQSMPSMPDIEGFSDDAFWAHSWACASAARLLGRPDYHVTALPGELYLAGLLHGIGKLVLAVHRPEEFAECLRVASKDQIPLHEAEREIFGFTDSTLGAKVLRSWDLPLSIRAAVAAYRAPRSVAPEQREFVALIQYAYIIANKAGIGKSGSECEVDLSATWIVSEGTSVLAQEPIQEQLVAEVQAGLSRKSDYFVGEEPEPEPEAKDLEVKPELEAAAVPATTSKQPARPRPTPRRRPRKKPGFWNRLKTWLNS